MDEVLLTLAEAERLSQEIGERTGTWGLRARALRAAIARGALPAVRRPVVGQISPLWFVARADLEAYMAARPQKVRPGRPPGRKEAMALSGG